jgi:hypothetical protein
LTKQRIGSPLELAFRDDGAPIETVVIDGRTGRRLELDDITVQRR